MKPSQAYQRDVDNLPPGSERTVCRVVSYRVGLEYAIPKDIAMKECEKVGTKFSNERQYRLTVIAARKKGVLICSSSGEGGYFMPATLEEYVEFRDREYLSKINDMRETIRAMDVRAKEIFADEYEKYQKEKSERAGQPALI